MLYSLHPRLLTLPTLLEYLLVPTVSFGPTVLCRSLRWKRVARRAMAFSPYAEPLTESGNDGALRFFFFFRLCLLRKLGRAPPQINIWYLCIRRYVFRKTYQSPALALAPRLAPGFATPFCFALRDTVGWPEVHAGQIRCSTFFFFFFLKTNHVNLCMHDGINIEKKMVHGHSCCFAVSNYRVVFSFFLFSLFFRFFLAPSLPCCD